MIQTPANSASCLPVTPKTFKDRQRVDRYSSHLLDMLWLRHQWWPIRCTMHHQSLLYNSLLHTHTVHTQTESGSNKWMKTVRQWYFHTAWSYMQMIFPSSFPSTSQYVRERDGSYVPCVCDVSPTLRWGRMPSDIPPALSAGEVRGITQYVYVPLDSDQNMLDCTFPAFITAHVSRKLK